MLEPPRLCPECHTELAPSLLTCPNCRRLVHAERLKELAEEAERAEEADDPHAALVAWRSAAELLPPRSRQEATILAKIAALGREIDSRPALPASPSSTPTPSGSRGGPGAAGIGALALVAWKMKAILLISLTKGKLLLLGLTKMSTFSSMAVSVGLYATALGWWFALGLVVMIYVHEMGHVMALVRYGVKATAPLFIPGLGAIIRLRQSLHDPHQDARVGLAGPVWGLGAAVVPYVIGAAGGGFFWYRLAAFGAWINLFNLMPLGTLDGGRAFHALTRPQRWSALTVVAVTWSLVPNSDTHGLLTLVMLVGLLTTLIGKTPPEPDRGALRTYVGLILALTALAYASLAALPGGKLLP